MKVELIDPDRALKLVWQVAKEQDCRCEKCGTLLEPHVESEGAELRLRCPNCKTNRSLPRASKRNWPRASRRDRLNPQGCPPMCAPSVGSG